ncbi:MAG: hypothetical protein IPG17_09855 [Sandaracinaceae bacterium]|nr:hypothetical protein [Sandaracinaceae bacterium]
MQPDRDSAFLLALAASIAVHVVGAGVAAFARPERARAAVIHSEGTIEVEWLEPVPEPELTPEPEAEVVEPEPLNPMAPPTTTPPPVLAGALAASTTAVTVDPGVVEPPLPEAGIRPEGSVRPPRSLDPRAVALGQLDVLPHQVAPQAQPSAVDPRARFRNAESTLDSHLSARAATRPAVTERPRPEVRRQADGSYVYAGHAFSARITPDGQVTFSDTARVTLSGAGDLPSSASGGVRFDLTDGAYRRRGQDPYQAERAWFMRETEGMREELQDAARERQRAQLGRQMAAQAQRAWDTEERTPESRRRRIFTLWDRCAEGDGDGDAARAGILGWVRRQLPAGSEHAFTAAELASFNAGRQSAAAFAPY